MTYFRRTKDDDYELRYRDKVLPCPFCGTPPMIMGSGEQSRGLMLHCIADGCPNPSASYYEHETTLRVWNKRHESEMLRDQVSNLETVIDVLANDANSNLSR